MLKANGSNSEKLWCTAVHCCAYGDPWGPMRTYGDSFLSWFALFPLITFALNLHTGWG